VLFRRAFASKFVRILTDSDSADAHMARVASSEKGANSGT